MKYTIAVVLLVCIGSVMSQYSRKEKCEDKLGTERCVRYKKLYGKMGISLCAGSLKSKCAITCKLCKPPAMCETSEYGCCWDRRTPARGPGNEGCPYCQDKKRSLCKSVIAKLLSTGRMTRKQACSYGWSTRNCPMTCGMCGVPAMAHGRCLNSLYGCCWNYKPAYGIHGEGCDKCEDTYPHTCGQFHYYCRKEGINEIFMRRNCPLTCGNCIKGQLLLDFYVKKH